MLFAMPQIQPIQMALFLIRPSRANLSFAIFLAPSRTRYPNMFGRVKMAGYLCLGDILRTDAAAVTMGTAFSIDPAASGYFKTGGATTVITAIRSDAVRVLTADSMVALGGSAVQGPPGVSIPTSGGANGYMLGYSGGTGSWRSPAQARADIGAAPLDSAALTGTPTAPTPATSANDMRIATTAFVHAVVAALVNSAPSQLDTIRELADALGEDANFAATMTAALAGKQPLDATLTALAAIVTATDTLIYANGVDSFATTAFTAVARTLLAATTQAAQRTALGLGATATSNTGASGYTVPLLGVANVWSAQQTSTQVPWLQSVSSSQPDANAVTVRTSTVASTWRSGMITARSISLCKESLSFRSAAAFSHR